MASSHSILLLSAILNHFYEFVTLSADNLAREHLSACHQHVVIIFVHNFYDWVIDDMVKWRECSKSRIFSSGVNALLSQVIIVEHDCLYNCLSLSE